LFADVPIIILSRLNLYTSGFNERGEHNKPYMFFTEEVSNEKYAQEFEAHFIKNMCYLAEDNPIFILKPLPEFGFNIPNEMIKRSFLSLKLDIKMSQGEYNKRNLFMSRLLAKTAVKCDVTIIDATAKIMQNGFYYGVIEGQPIYRDDNHLNNFGALFISSVFDRIW
jgi:hypothetical protein